MKIFNKLRDFFIRHKLTRLQIKRLNDQKEMEEYNAREEEYMDKLRDEEQKYRFLSKMDNIKRTTYTKKMVSVILLVCILDIQLSYILAFFDKGQVVDSLSNQLCLTILGVAFAYMIRAYFDSKAEHKNLDNDIKKELNDSLSSKIDNVFKSAGLNIDVNKFLNPANDTDEKSSVNFNIDINNCEGNDN